MVKPLIWQKISQNEPLPVNWQITGPNNQPIPVSALGLSLPEYLVFQRAYFEAEQKHLDDGTDWTWLSGSRLGSRLAGVGWDPSPGQLGVLAHDSDDRSGNLGFRLSRSFS